MWQQVYFPVDGQVGASCLIAAIPIFVVLFLIGVFRRPAWISSLAGLAAALLVSIGPYRMPVVRAVSATLYGAAFGLFPIGWVVFWAILLYRITVESGKFALIKDSLGNLAADRGLQALLIAFAFGAFIEGASGFGTPVAVAGAMLAGLGFSPFYAAGICLLANTAPVAFGAIGIPIVTLAGITGLPLERLSAGVGRICAPVSLFVPAYLIWVMSGKKGLRRLVPAVAVCGAAFAGTQFLISNYVGVYLTDILSSLVALTALVGLLCFWKPRNEAVEPPAGADRKIAGEELSGLAPAVNQPSQAYWKAWAPYGFLVLLVLLWGYAPLLNILNRVNIFIQWPGLHNLVMRMPPVTAKPSEYPAIFNLNLFSASGTACLIASLLSAVWLRMSWKKFGRVFVDTVRQMFLAELTLASVLALAFLMNYSGATATLGLGFAETGKLFPFFSALLGWVGVFMTGSDTSSNALFGNLQVVTATNLHMNPVLMAASNSAGGVMGKMISLQSIAVAAAATNMKSSEEPKLFRFTLRHSIFLATMIGLVVTFYAYVAPRLAP